MEGIRHVMDTGVQVDIQRQVSKSYHMPVGIVPEISSYYLCVRLKISYMYVMTGSLLHSLTPRPSSIQAVLNHLSMGQFVFNLVLLMSIRCGCSKKNIGILVRTSRIIYTSCTELNRFNPVKSHHLILLLHT